MATALVKVLSIKRNNISYQTLFVSTDVYILEVSIKSFWLQFFSQQIYKIYFGAILWDTIWIIVVPTFFLQKPFDLNRTRLLTRKSLMREYRREAKELVKKYIYAVSTLFFYYFNTIFFFVHTSRVTRYIYRDSNCQCESQYLCALLQLRRDGNIFF